MDATAPTTPTADAHWHALSAADAVARLTTDVQRGLDAREASARRPP